MRKYVTVWGFVKELSNVLNGVRDSESSDRSVLEAREDIKKILKSLHEFLLSKTTDRNAYFALFGLVAHLDESMEQCTQKLIQEPWYPLQRELFEISDAGTLYYQYADFFRGRNDIPVFVYEIFYFCLKDGFKGSMINEPEVRNAYLEELRVHIPVESMPHPQEIESCQNRSYTRIPLWSYYLSILFILWIVRAGLKLMPLAIDI